MSLLQNREAAPSLPFRNSIVTKIGVVFGLFALIYSAFLVTTLYMTSQLIGVSTAIDEAGAQRMRVYRIGLLMNSAGQTEQDRLAIRNERDRWVAVWKG